MILTTKRLVLREFEEEDWPAVLAYQTDPRYLRYYDWTQRTEQDVRAFARMFIVQREEEPRTKFQLAITLAPGGQLIGNCGIRMKTPGVREADLGYELDPRYWENGYATEAARALLAFGFQEGVAQVLATAKEQGVEPPQFAALFAREARSAQTDDV